MPALGGATGWLNSEPLGPAELRGHAVLVNFWTLTCINWLRTGALRPRVVAGLPRRRADRDRSPHPGVLLRARDRPRAPSDAAASDRLPGRPRQRLRDLGRLRQPLLAGALLRRRRGHHPRPALRRRTVRAIRARHPGAARRRARARRGRRSRRRDGGRLGPPADARDVSGLRAQRALRLTGPRRVRPTRRLRAPRAPAPQPLGPCGRVDDRARERRARPGRREHRLPLPRARRASRAVSRARASRSPSACSSTARLPAPRTAWTSTRTGTACSAKAACTSSCASTTRCASGRSRSPSSSPAPRRYVFTFG